MEDPVATVDGHVYERELISRWIRECRQQRKQITSPATGLELASTQLMPAVVALKRAIETYMMHRPELKRQQMVGRPFEEAAQMLQHELLEQQVMHQSLHDELNMLRGKLQDMENLAIKLQNDLAQEHTAHQMTQENLRTATTSLHEALEENDRLREEMMTVKDVIFYLLAATPL